MKHKSFVILLLVAILITNSGSALAQGEIPPAGSENFESLPKSAFLSLGTGNPNREIVTLKRDADALAASPLINGDFEQGPNVGWSEYSAKGWPVVTPTGGLSLAPRSGNWAVWLGGDDSEIAYVAQLLTLPTPASLQLYYWTFSTDDCGYDVARLRIRREATSLYEDLHQWSLCSSNNSSAWMPLQVDLSAYAGQSVEILIDISTDEGYFSNLFIDDVALFGNFKDVAYGYWAEDYVLRLYNAGVTGGCGTALYCPETAVTRDQMAVFLERGIHGSSYSPPAPGASTGFADVPITYWAANWIKQLAAEGITSGCGIDLYCPDAPVTRAQMAVFLLRSKYGTSYSPPAVGATTGFTDVPITYWAAAWIKQLVAEGITAGCGSGNYCPEAPVTRAQMAVFLVRTFNLP